MSIEIKEVQVKEEQIVKVTCNKCKTSYTEDDMIEWQEFFMHVTRGGYGSLVGDEQLYRIDLCQTCMKEVLDPYIELVDE